MEFFPTYYTVLVPFSEKPTKWHPTERIGPFSTLTRGAFMSEADAHAWASANLDGQTYSVRPVADSERELAKLSTQNAELASRLASLRADFDALSSRHEALTQRANGLRHALRLLLRKASGVRAGSTDYGTWKALSASDIGEILNAARAALDY